ncbi:MAG: hypothetical protein AAFQ27_03525 [Pseudomonadota bacterium]
MNRLFSRLALLLCISLSFAASPASADETTAEPVDDVFDRGCGDDNGTDRCDAEIQKSMRDLYGWATAEALLDQGVQFRRFMMVDGYGRDVLGLTMERRPGSGPRVHVEVPKREDGDSAMRREPLAPLTANLTLEQWNRALDATEFIEQKLADEGRTFSEQGDGTLTICLHGWFTVVEAGDPALVGSGSEPKAKLRTDAEGSCAKGLTMPAAFELANIAYSALTACHELDEEEFRNRMMLLAHCKNLGGDRLAASKASRFVRKLEDHLYDTARSKKDLSLQSFVDFKQEGLAAKLATRLEGATVYLGVPFATDQKHAYVLGTISPADQPPDEANAYTYADIRLDLRNRGKIWPIEAYEISDLKTVTYENEQAKAAQPNTPGGTIQ